MKQIVKTFNILIKKTIFKVQNKTNNNFKISNFNKFLITFIGLLFLYLFYLSIPLLYDKTWVQTNMESKLLNEFRVNLSTSANISYRILPAPHFLIKKSKILVNSAGKQRSIAEIKDLKVFLSQSNFFDKNKMKLKKIIINEANFSLLRSDLKLVNKFRNKLFSNKKIEINKSNIFFNDDSGEIISIVKIDNATLFFDNTKLSNFLNVRGEVFNIPFTLKSLNNLKKYETINFNFKKLKLNIFNESKIKNNNLISGENIISLFNSKIRTRYNIKDKLIIFDSDDSRINNSQVSYKGKLSINPFDLDLNIYFDNYEISKLSNINPVLNEFIQSGLLFNDNISVNTSININSNLKNEIFQNAEINFHIINGKANFNNTRFVNDKIGLLEINNSSLFFKDKSLVLNTDILIDIKDADHLFFSLNANKNSRKRIKDIFINLDYDFLSNQIKFNNIKIDNNEANDQLKIIIDDFNYNDLNNPNKRRRFINELLKAHYDG